MICKLQTRAKSLSEIVCTIALVGFPGVGKSTFLNSILADDAESKNLVPVSGSDVCTAVPIIVKHGVAAIKAEVHFVSLDDFVEDCRVYCQDLTSHPDDNRDSNEVTAASREKLQALFGCQIEDELTLEDLKATDVWSVIEHKLEEGVKHIECNSVSTNYEKQLSCRE